MHYIREKLINNFSSWCIKMYQYSTFLLLVEEKNCWTDGLKNSCLPCTKLHFCNFLKVFFLNSWDSWRSWQLLTKPGLWIYGHVHRSLYLGRKRKTKVSFLADQLSNRRWQCSVYKKQNQIQTYKTSNIHQTVLRKYHRNAPGAFIMKAKEKWMQASKRWKCMICTFKSTW